MIISRVECVIQKIWITISVICFLLFFGCNAKTRPLPTGETTFTNFPSPKSWTRHTNDASSSGADGVKLADINEDGIVEAVVTERSEQKIRIYKRLNETGTAWKEQTIALPASTGTAKSVAVGDLNGDGVSDLVHSTNTNGEDKVELVDLDSDGDLDVLTCEENHGPNSEGLGVIWYENPFK